MVKGLVCCELNISLICFERQQFSPASPKYDDANFESAYKFSLVVFGGGARQSGGGRNY
jgi:hypothetical protein